MDSRGLVWSQQQKIPHFWAVGWYTITTCHRPTVIAFDRKKKKKAFSKSQNNCGGFLEHLSVQCSKGTLPSAFTWKFAPTPTRQQTRGKQNPMLRIHVTCIWNMKGSQAGLYHHPGCFPLDTFQLVNVQKTWLSNGLICTEDLLPVLIPPWLFRVKLFSFNVK